MCSALGKLLWIPKAKGLLLCAFVIKQESKVT